jgi:hypothetical protein
MSDDEFFKNEGKEIIEINCLSKVNLTWNYLMVFWKKILELSLCSTWSKNTSFNVIKCKYLEEISLIYDRLIVSV